MAASLTVKRAAKQVRGRGRPPGAVTVLTRELANEIVASGFTPIHVMHDNMRFFFEKGERLTTRLEHMLAQTREDQVVNAERFHEMIALLHKINTARQLAEQCAVDLAPYVHPRLSSIALQNGLTDPITIEYSEVEARL